MQTSVINVNGQILGPDEAKVSVFDRGYLYGDSLYEVARTYQGKFFELDGHLERLKKSADLCHMPLNQSLAEYRKEILRTFEAFRSKPGNHSLEAYARLIVSRGVGKIGFGQSAVMTPTLYTIIVQPLDPPTETQFQRGVKLGIVKRLRNDPRALDPAMKSGNYLNSLLAYLEATSEGWYDALLCNSDGHLTEGTTFNIFYARRGMIATPPLDIGILDGITRRCVIDLAREMGFPVREVRFPKERLYEADEVFLTSSIKEVFPITEIDGVKIGKGGAGPISKKLLAAFRSSILERIA